MHLKEQAVTVRAHRRVAAALRRNFKRLDSLLRALFGRNGDFISLESSEVATGSVLRRSNRLKAGRRLPARRKKGAEKLLS